MSLITCECGSQWFKRERFDKLYAESMFGDDLPFAQRVEYRFSCGECGEFLNLETWQTPHVYKPTN